ncbi:MAG: hypothetical protein J5838_02975 [Desulfovibrio sp.]|nr:hypothetical protein [Desulfovibrio sp.]
MKPSVTIRGKEQNGFDAGDGCIVIKPCQHGLKATRERLKDDIPQQQVVGPFFCRAFSANTIHGREETARGIRYVRRPVKSHARLIEGGFLGKRLFSLMKEKEIRFIRALRKALNASARRVETTSVKKNAYFRHYQAISQTTLAITFCSRRLCSTVPA